MKRRFLENYYVKQIIFRVSRSVRDDLESCLGSAMFEPSATVVNDSTFSPVGADTRSRTSDSKAPEKKGEMPLFPHSGKSTNGTFVKMKLLF